LGGKPEGESPLGRWEDHIKMNLEEVKWRHGLDYSADDRDRWWAPMIVGMNLLCSTECREFFD